MDEPKWKNEEWNGHHVRFIEMKPHEWWAVLADIAAALGLHSHEVTQRIKRDKPIMVPVQAGDGVQEIHIIRESAIYTMLAEAGGMINGSELHIRQEVSYV